MGFRLAFSPVGEGDLDFLYPYDPSRIKIQHFHKVGRYHRGAQEVLHFLRIYPSALGDLSSSMLDLEWSRMEPFTKQVTQMSIRAGLKSLLRGLSPNSW